MDGPSSSLPFQVQPHDALRLGLSSLKEDAKIKHPVEAIQRTHVSQAAATQAQAQRDLYGLAFPAKNAIERQILGRFQRLPGLTSSRLGLESLTGALDEFSFESYVGLPEWDTRAPVDLHSQMEAKLNLGTKAVARGIV